MRSLIVEGQATSEAAGMAVLYLGMIAVFFGSRRGGVLVNGISWTSDPGEKVKFV